MLQLFPVRNAPMTFTELQYLLRRRGGRLVGSVAFAVALGFALPASDASALFIVNLPWVSPARKSQTTHAYMNLTSTDGATLLSARSEDARSVSLHSARAAVAALALPARSEVALAPGHDRLALTGLRRTLKIGDRVKITLTVRDDNGAVSEVEVNAEVRLRSPIDDERRAHHHH
jgi:copper(I)-binding protein